MPLQEEPGEFAGKVVIVTGAASGLGKVTAQAFAAAGAQVVMTDVNADGLNEVAASISAQGGCTVAVPANLVDESIGELIVGRALQEFGRLDVLVNVAGVFHFNPVGLTTAAAWDLVYAVNVRAPFLLAQAALPHLVEHHGAMVNIVSSSAFFGHAYLSAYASSKAALLSLTRSLAIEFARSPVRINGLAPGGMNTPLVSGMTSLPEGVDRSLMSRYSGLRPPNEPEEMVDLILFLASPRASAVHGACFTADGGITAG